MIIFLQQPFDLKKLQTLKNSHIITFDYESHKILSKCNIEHIQSEEFLNEDDFESIENTCNRWTEWFNQENIKKEITFNGINLGSLFRWEFHFYLIPIIKKIFEIKKISEQVNEFECSCSAFLENIAKRFFKSTELFDNLKNNDTLLFDSIKLNLTNNLEINIKKENFEKAKKISEKVLVNFSKLNQKKDHNKKSILFIEFDPVKYENLFSNISNSNINPIFFNKRRPYFWDIRSFRIINQTGGEIILDKEIHNVHTERDVIYQKILSLDEYYFEKHFSLNKNSFWNIIKDEFLKILEKKIEEGIKLIKDGEELFKNKNIDEIIVWSENGFSEQVIIELGKKNKIPINLIQHGIIVDKNDNRNNIFNKLSGIIPTNSNRYLVWNKSTQNYMISLGFSVKNIIQIGNPNFDIISDNKKYLESNYVLLTTTGPRKSQHAGYNSKLLDNYEYELSIICKKIKEQKKKLVVRPHPFSQEFKIDDVVEEAYPDAIIDKKTEINSLIKNSEVVITYGVSTIFFEAQVLKKPVFFISAKHDMFGIPEYIKKNPESIIRFNEIENCISRIYENEKFKNSIINTNSTIMSDEFFNLGRSTANFLKIYE